MKVSSTPIDCDISTLNVLFYRSPNFMPYSNVSACKAAQRGGGGLKEAAQAITKQLTYIGHLKFLLACIGQAAA